MLDTRVFEGPSGSPLIILNTLEDEGEEIYGKVRSLTDADFSLATIRVHNWNLDLSPWEAPAVFGDEPFGGGADRYLEYISGTFVPNVIGSLARRPRRTIIAGYSLAGLFSIYSLYRTDIFDAAVSASGSLWFPGFLEMMEKEEMIGNPQCIYLSLGDKESSTKNPVMSTVWARTHKASGIIASKGIDTIFESNPGNHFREPVLRTAKGIAWVLDHISK